MKPLLTILLLTVAASCATPQSPSRSPSASSLGCAAIPGMNVVLRRPERYLVFGEIHGTAEAPAMFAEIACLAASQGPIAVGVEWPVDRQPALDAFMTSDGGPAAHKALVQSRPDGMQDGRNSVAFYAMIERLRTMKARGADLHVAAFIAANVQSDPSGSQSPYDKGMADTLVAGAGKAKGVLALVGNIHSRRDEVSGGARSPSFLPMAADLPAQDTLSFNAHYLEGSAWNCQARAGASGAAATNDDIECSDHPMMASADPGDVGVRILEERRNHHDGTWMIGRPTGSPPDSAQIRP